VVVTAAIAAVQLVCGIPRAEKPRHAVAQPRSIVQSPGRFGLSANACKAVGQMVTKGAAKTRPACIGLTLYPILRVGTESAGKRAVWKTLK
jgi:hypothetical protein